MFGFYDAPLAGPTFHQWLLYRTKATSFGDNKNRPGKLYPKFRDNIDICGMCGVEIPPGPDFCGPVCEALFELAHRKSQVDDPAVTPSEPTYGDLTEERVQELRDQYGTTPTL